MKDRAEDGPERGRIRRCQNVEEGVLRKPAGIGRDHRDSARQSQQGEPRLVLDPSRQDERGCARKIGRAPMPGE